MYILYTLIVINKLLKMSAAGSCFVTFMQSQKLCYCHCVLNQFVFIIFTDSVHSGHCGVHQIPSESYGGRTNEGGRKARKAVQGESFSNGLTVSDELNLDDRQ